MNTGGGYADGSIIIYEESNYGFYRFRGNYNKYCLIVDYLSSMKPLVETGIVFKNWVII